MHRRAYRSVLVFLGTGITVRTLVRCTVSVTALMLVVGIIGSRSFIEPVDAVKAVMAAGYAVPDPKGEGVLDSKATSAALGRVPVETHYVLPNRFGCKTLDAIAFVLSARKTPESKSEPVTVCCGAWFSGCAVRKM